VELQFISSTKKIDLSEIIFSCEFNEPLVHQVVTAYMAAGRAGTKAQKTRAQVRGGGAKPWKQKGTGRARAGTIRSPLWRKGGVIFAATPRSYKQKVNKKMYRGAIRSIFSELIRQNRLHIVDTLTVESTKTKQFLIKLKSFNLSGRVLIISDAIEENLYLSVRNLPHIDLRDTTESVSDPVSLIRAEHILITEVALKQLEEVLK
jgi:large subunit ribosomal protein L4